MNCAILVFIRAHRAHVVFIRLFISSAAGAAGAAGSARSLGGTDVMNGCQGLALPADGWGGGCMLMAYCFKALACRNLQRCKSLSPPQPHQFVTARKCSQKIKNKKGKGGLLGDLKSNVRRESLWREGGGARTPAAPYVS